MVLGKEVVPVNDREELHLPSQYSLHSRKYGAYLLRKVGLLQFLSFSIARVASNLPLKAEQRVVRAKSGSLWSSDPSGILRSQMRCLSSARPESLQDQVG